MLKKFNMVDAKPVSTTLVSRFILSAKQSPYTEAELEEMKKIPCAVAFGCLMYAMVCTRSDLARAMSVVSKYMSNAGRVHWQAIKWILRYLKGTRICIMFERQLERCASLILLTPLYGRFGQAMVYYRLFFHLWWRTNMLEVYAPIDQCFINYERRIHGFNGATNEVIWL